MNYKTKQIWVFLTTAVIFFLVYVSRVFGIVREYGKEIFIDTSFWAKTMLIYIGIGVGVIIIVQILFNIGLAIFTAIKSKVESEITKEVIEIEEVIEDVFDDTEDEMDQLIKLKAGRIGYIVTGISFFAGLMIIFFGGAIGVMLNLLYISFIVGGMIESVVKLIYYKRGVSHG